MSKINKLSKEIPETNHTFPISVDGDTTKKKYVGEFSCKIPTRKDQCSIDKHRAFLNGPFPGNLEPETLRFHHMISYLRYTLTEFPKFWKDSDLGYELYDENVVVAIYDEVLNFEVEWMKMVWGEEEVAKRMAKSRIDDGEEQEASEEKSA